MVSGKALGKQPFFFWLDYTHQNYPQYKFVVFCLLFFVGTFHLYLEVWKTKNNCYQQGILLKHHNKFISIILTPYRCLQKKTKTYYVTTSVLKSTIPSKKTDWQNALPEKHIHPSTLHYSPLIAHLSTPINLEICWVPSHEGNNKNLQRTHVGLGTCLKPGIEINQVMETQGWNKHPWSWRNGTSNNERSGKQKHLGTFKNPPNCCWFPWSSVQYFGLAALLEQPKKGLPLFSPQLRRLEWRFGQLALQGACLTGQLLRLRWIEHCPRDC